MLNPPPQTPRAELNFPDVENQDTFSDTIISFLNSTGRATHIHTILHRNATARENGTIYDLTASHIGQTFWDQSVRDAVELLSPYNTNTNAVTLNADDKVVIAETEVNGTSDPFFNYVQLGETIEDGFLAWIVLAVNTSLSTTVNPAAVYYASGGVELS